MIAGESGRRSWLLTNLPKPSRDDVCETWRLVRSLPDQTRIQYAGRAARQASDLNPVRLFHRVLLETGFAQEVSVRS